MKLRHNCNPGTRRSQRELESNLRIGAIRTILLAFLGLSGPALARADTVNWVAGGGGNWNTAGNWSAARVPLSSDNVVFPAGSGAYTVIMNAKTGNCRSLDIDGNATLKIDSGNTLCIGDCDGQISNIDGYIWLYGSGSTLRLMYDHTIQPKSVGNSVTAICSTHSNAEIEDDPSNPSTLTLRRNGNSGYADISCYLIFNVDRLRIEAGVDQCAAFAYGNGVRTLENAGGTLRFGSARTNLTCDFVLSSGTLAIEANVETSGQLTFSGGTIQVDAGKYFKASQ